MHAAGAERRVGGPRRTPVRAMRLSGGGGGRSRHGRAGVRRAGRRTMASVDRLARLGAAARGRAAVVVDNGVAGDHCCPRPRPSRAPRRRPAGSRADGTARAMAVAASRRRVARVGRGRSAGPGGGGRRSHPLGRGCRSRLADHGRRSRRAPDRSHGHDHAVGRRAGHWRRARCGCSTWRCACAPALRGASRGRGRWRGR